MDFYKRIGLACSMIPYGKAATYGQIALLCGKPRNARQVGYGLKKGCAGENIPAHRVLNSQGFLTGAQAFEYPDMQQKLLEGEGIIVSRERKVELGKYGWKNTIEDAISLRRRFEDLNI